MMKNRDYKQKFQLLVAGLLILGWVSWKFAIGDTVQVASEAHTLRQRIEQAENASARIAQLKQQLQEVDQHFGAAEQSSTNIPEEMYDYVSRYCKLNELRMQAYPTPHQFTDQTHLIETELVTVEGDYIGLVQLLNELENEFGKARVAAVNFYAEEDRKTKKTRLYADFYLQTIRKV